MSHSVNPSSYTDRINFWTDFIIVDFVTSAKVYCSVSFTNASNAGENVAGQENGIFFPRVLKSRIPVCWYLSRTTSGRILLFRLLLRVTVNKEGNRIWFLLSSLLKEVLMLNMQICWSSITLNRTVHSLLRQHSIILQRRLRPPCWNAITSGLKMCRLSMKMILSYTEFATTRWK